MKKTKSSSVSISIITPFYNEEVVMDSYFETLIPILENITKDWEIICIDDGSIDETKNILLSYGKKDRRIKLLSFSRNFGKEAAISAGLDYVSKNAVIPIDADLQDPPTLIPEMIEQWKLGFQVVLAARKKRDESWSKRFFAALYHKLINLLTNGNIPMNVGDFRLIDIKVVKSIRMLNERNRFMKGVLSWVGYKHTTIFYDRPSRICGDSKLGFLKLFKLGLDGIISFSSKPLKIWFYLGLIFSLISFLYACFLIFRTIFFGVDLPGYASIMVVVLFMGGVQLISLGVIGEYIARIFKEVKQRPIYIVDEMHGFD